MHRILTLSIVALAMATAAGAQVAITLPDETQSSTLTANVMEQATVTVPATITFNVTDVSVDTPAAPSPITVTGIVLPPGMRLGILIKSAAESFSGSGVTYAAADVGWGSASWNNGASESDPHLGTVFVPLARCDAGVSACSTTDAKFNLRANPAVTVAGPQTLVMNYKFEAIY